MSNSVLKDLFKRHGSPENISLVFDVDLTLCNSMCTQTSVSQRNLMLELSNRTGNGVILGSGRGASSLDITFSGRMPLFAEHFACMRIESGGDIIPLAYKTDTAAVVEQAIALLDNKVPVANSGSEVREKFEISSMVYPESKDFGVALVHSLGHPNVGEDRKILKTVAHNTIETMGLQSTHKVTAGNDAIEIVPKGLDPNSPAIDILSENAMDIIRQNGLSKETAIPTFMSLDNYKERIPYTIGDSAPDGNAMLECQKYGGGGVWVKNGKSIPKDFKKAVDSRIIDNYSVSWNHIEAAVQYLRQKAAKFHLPESFINPPKIVTAIPKRTYS